MKKIVLIDGHSILNRAFYGLPDLTNQAGEHTGAVLGFLNIILKLLEEEQATHLIVSFDVHAPTFRHLQYAEYKGNRKPMPEELRQQVPLMKDVLTAMGIMIVAKEGYEADDVIGTLSRKARDTGFTVTILSGDRDLLQLATDDILVRIPKTKQSGTTIEDYYAKDVEAAYGVGPVPFIDLKGLMGDASDNIPGVPGIGEKTAAKILSEFGSIENAYAHIEDVTPARARENLREYYDQALMSRDLATIRLDCPLEVDLEKAKIGQMFNERSYQIMKRLEFKNLLAKFSDAANTGNHPVPCERIDDPGRAAELFGQIGSASCLGFTLVVEGGRLLGVSICFSEEAVYYLPAEGALTEAYLCGQMTSVLSVVPKSYTVQLKPMLSFLNGIGDTAPVLDLELAAYLCNPLKSTYSYDDLARDYLMMTIPSREESIGKGSLSDAFRERQEQALQVVGYMAWIPYLAGKKMEEELENRHMDALFREIEMPTLYTLFDMEQRGIKVNRDELREYGKRLSKGIASLEASIYEQAGETFNINSPKQLGEILFSRLGLPGSKKTKTGYSTNADILERLKGEYPIVSDILEYRALTKLRSTYAEGLDAFIGESDQRIHSKFHQTITATGRLSSTDPNLQNIPIRTPLGREIRKVFIPEDGYVFVDADYSQIELRVLAHMSGDETMIRAFRDGTDIHAVTASQVFHVPPDEVTPLQRRNAKAVNFGIVYGISAFGLSQDLNISRKEAADYIDQYFATYGKVRDFLDRLVKEAKETGSVSTMFGRIRPIPELKSSNFMQRSFGERAAMNSPIQGTAADIIKIAMTGVNRRLKEKKMKSRLLLQIHDELLVEAHETEVDAVREVLRDEMMGVAELAVPLSVDIHTGSSWYEAK